MDITECMAYNRLLKAVEKDEADDLRHRDKPSQSHREKLAWVIERAIHYGERLGIDPKMVLDSWESKRTYWYHNYYQDCNQPLLADDAKIFENQAEYQASVKKPEFRCPMCKGISTDPYECNSGIMINNIKQGSKGKIACNWKSYGLFGTMGKGVHVILKDSLSMATIFMPIAWEKEANSEGNIE